MSIRLFACTTKVCCGPCPANYDILLKKLGCPSTTEIYGWEVPSNITGAYSCYITWVDGCGASHNYTALFEVKHITDLYDCESHQSTMAWIPSVWTVSSSSTGCQLVSPTPKTLTIYDSSLSTIAYYTDDYLGTADPPFAGCSLGRLQSADGAPIAKIESSATMPNTDKWPCRIDINEYDVCSSTDKFYSLKDSSADAIEAIGDLGGCLITSVILLDDTINSAILSKSDIDSQLGCPAGTPTWNGKLNFVPTKVDIYTTTGGPPRYTVSNNCEGFVATIDTSVANSCNTGIRCCRLITPDRVCVGYPPERAIRFIIDIDAVYQGGGSTGVVSVKFVMGLVGDCSNEVEYTGILVNLTDPVTTAFKYIKIGGYYTWNCTEVNGPCAYVSISTPHTNIGSWKLVKIKVARRDSGVYRELTYIAGECRCLNSDGTDPGLYTGNIDLYDENAVEIDPNCNPTYPTLYKGTSVGGATSLTCQNGRDDSSLVGGPSNSGAVSAFLSAIMDPPTSLHPLVYSMNINVTKTITVTVPTGIRGGGGTYSTTFVLSKSSCSSTIWVTGTFTATASLAYYPAGPQLSENSGDILVADLIPGSKAHVWVKLNVISGLVDSLSNCAGSGTYSTYNYLQATLTIKVGSTP